MRPRHRLQSQRAAARQNGQALVMVAIIMPVLIFLLFVGIEVMDRYYNRALLEDGLQRAARSAVQQFNYEAFSRGDVEISTSRAQDTGRRVFRANIDPVNGLLPSGSGSYTPAQIRDQLTTNVRWEVLAPNVPTSNTSARTCTYDNSDPNDNQLRGSGEFVNIPDDQPIVCAYVNVRMEPLVPVWPFDNWTSRIRAAATLDRL